MTLCCVSMSRELAQPRLSRSLPAAVLAGSLQSRPMAFSAVSLGAKIAFEMRSGLTSELEPTLGLLELFTTGCSTFTMNAPERFSTLFNHYSRFKMQSGLVQWIGRLMPGLCSPRLSTCKETRRQCSFESSTRWAMFSWNGQIMLNHLEGF